MTWNVAAVMTREVVTVLPEATYKEVVELMAAHRVSAVPVVDADLRVAGMISEADLLLKEERPPHRPRGPLLDPHGEAARAEARTAAALMTAPAIIVRPETPLREAARLMHHRRVKRLPVVDGGGRLVGIVSRADLLMPFLREDQSIESEVRDDVVKETLMLDPDSVTVTVQGGVVRLEGDVESRSLAGILARLVNGVEGVVGVDNRLAWRLDDRSLGVVAPPLAERYSADER